MKKLIYIILFAFSTALTITSCTEEEIVPTSEITNSSGGAQDDGKL